MSNQVLNWPRKLLSDREQTIRATLARITSTASTATPIPHSMAPYIYVPLAEKDSLQFYLDSLTTGGTIILDQGTYYLTSRLRMRTPNVTLMGMGMFATELKYILDANTDIITIERGRCTICDLRIAGSDHYGNGGGAIGTGRGIVIADTTDVCQQPTIRNVEVANTGSWCIYSREVYEPTDLGTGVLPNRNYGYPLVATGCHETVDLTIDNCQLAFPNSGGALFLGYGCAAPRISALTVNSYSFGTYTKINAAGGVAENIGAVHLVGVAAGSFDDRCVFQSCAPQSGTPDVVHADDDATMISLLNTGHMAFYAPYFEILSPSLAVRNHYYITGINSNFIEFLGGFFQNDSVNTPMKFCHTPADDVAFGVIFKNCRGVQPRDTYSLAGTPAVDPYVNGDPLVWDRDDFVFEDTASGVVGSDIRVEDCYVVNNNSGKSREWTTPASPDPGYSIIARSCVSFSNGNRPIQMGKFTTLDGGGPGASTDVRARWALSHEALQGGVFGYTNAAGGILLRTQKNGTNVLTSGALFTNIFVGMSVSGTGIPANSYITIVTSTSNITMNNVATDSLLSTLTFTPNGALQHEGLWGLSVRGNDWRQIPWIRVQPSAFPSVYAGDMWMKLTGSPTQSLYPNAQFAWYDGTQWQYVPTGLLAGDMPYYTAAGVSAILGIGNANYVMASTGTAPGWVLDSQRDVVDGLGNVVTSGGFVVVA